MRSKSPRSLFTGIHPRRQVLGGVRALALEELASDELAEDGAVRIRRGKPSLSFRSWVILPSWWLRRLHRISIAILCCFLERKRYRRLGLVPTSRSVVHIVRQLGLRAQCPLGYP